MNCWIMIGSRKYQSLCASANILAFDRIDLHFGMQQIDAKPNSARLVQTETNGQFLSRLSEVGV